MALTSLPAIPLIRPRTPTKTPFKFFEIITSTGVPSPYPAPFVHLPFDDRHPFTGNDPANGYTQVLTRAAADFWAGRKEAMILDVEIWNDSVTNDKPSVDQSIADISQIVAWVNNQQPNVPFGAYQWGPASGFITAFQNNADWITDCEYLFPLTQKFDFLNPSWYLYSAYAAQITAYATNSAAQTRRYNRPFYPDVWPYWHDQPNVYMGDTNWRLILDLARSLADGVCVFTAATPVYNRSDSWVKILKNWAAEG